MKIVQILFFISFFNLEIRVRANSDLNFHTLSPSKVIFLKGSAHLQNKELKQIETIYGSIYTKEADLWLITQGNQILIRSVQGQIEIHARDGQKINLLNGFQVTLGGITSEGKSWIEIPRPIDVQDHLKRWKEEFQGSKTEFKKQASAFINLRKQAVEISSKAYQKNIDRHIASMAEEEKKTNEKLQRQKQNRARLREIYYQRVFER